jgi:hypothetical protein
VGVRARRADPAEGHGGVVHLDVEWSRLGGIDSPIPTFAAPI